VLERIATGAPLEEVLETLAHLIEEQARGMRCAVFLADLAQTRLRFAAGPGIPADYRENMAPYLGIAPNMGSCGIAAYFRQPVYTRDTATDDQWREFRDIALRNGLRAVWSTPILADDVRVLGTFAMFYSEPRLPDEEDIRLIDMAVQMARVAIEAKADGDLLSTLFDASPSAMFVTDLAGNIIRANIAFAKRLGYAPMDLHGKPLDEITESDDNAALVRELSTDAPQALSDRRYRTRNGSAIWARERSTLRRDTSGEPRYVLSRVVQFSHAGVDPLDQLSKREREVLELVVGGGTSKEIAARLRISHGSVDTYRSRIMLKLGIEDLPALVRFAIRHGIASV
jgi:PAS domain S-box-containing protein